MKLIDRKIFVTLTTIGALIIVGYLYYLKYSGDIRMQDHTLSGDEMQWWELIVFVVGTTSIVSLLLSSVSHTIKSRRWLWFVLIILVWPLSIIYAWIYGRNGNTNS